MPPSPVQLRFARSADLIEIAQISREQIEQGLHWRYTPDRLRRTQARSVALWPWCPFALPRAPQIFLNSGLRTCCTSAAEKNFSMKMSRSNRRPCISAVMQASIISGGPHR